MLDPVVRHRHIPVSSAVETIVQFTQSSPKNITAAATAAAAAVVVVVVVMVHLNAIVCLVSFKADSHV